VKNLVFGKKALIATEPTIANGARGGVLQHAASVVALAAALDRYCDAALNHANLKRQT
jgi:hypothetical protein